MPNREHNSRCLKTRFRRGSGWGIRYPKAPSRIAREGFLTEGASSPTPPAHPRRAREGVTTRHTAGERPAEEEQSSGIRKGFGPNTGATRAFAGQGRREQKGQPRAPRGLIHFCPSSTGVSLTRANYTRAQGAASGLRQETPAQRETGDQGTRKKDTAVLGSQPAAGQHRLGPGRECPTQPGPSPNAAGANRRDTPPPPREDRHASLLSPPRSPAGLTNHCSGTPQRRPSAWVSVGEQETTTLSQLRAPKRRPGAPQRAVRHAPERPKGGARRGRRTALPLPG